MGEIGKDSGVGPDESHKVKKRWSMKQGLRAQKFILLHWWTSVIWRLLNWRQPKKKVELYSEVILWKMILDLMQYSLNRVHQHHKWQQPRSWISSPDCQVVQDKPKTPYLLIPESKWKMHHLYWRSPNRKVQTFIFVYHDTSGQNHGPVWKTQSFLLSEICMVILWQDCYGKGNLRKSFWVRLGENSKLGMSLCASWKRIILICVCGWHKIGWKETKSWSDVETTQPRSRFGRTNIFPGSCILGLHSKTMWNKQKYCGQLQNHVRIANFRGRVEKLPFLQHLRISSWSYEMAGHAKKCVERYCELANKTTQQLYKVSTPCIDDHHFKEEEMKICTWIVKSILSNCSERLLLGTNWTTLYSMVSK